MMERRGKRNCLVDSLDGCGRRRYAHEPNCKKNEDCFCLFATRLLVINKDADLWARSNTVMLLSEPAATTAGDRISFNEAMHVTV